MVSAESLNEYQAFQNQSGFHVAQDFALLRMTGKDRLAFLHNFCTADIKALSPGELTEAFVLDPKGKTLFFILVLAAEEYLTLAIPNEQKEGLTQHLDRYIIVEDVQIELAEGDQLVFTSWEIPKGAKCSITDSTWLSVLDNAETISEWKEGGKVEVTEEAWEMIRVESGFPISGIDVTQDCLAQEFERDETAISYTKGCYLGQETVARLDALGHTNRAFRVAKCSGDELPGFDQELISGDKTVGRVKSAAWSPVHQCHLVLAMIKKPNHQVGTELSWGDQTVTPVEINSVP